MHTCEQKLGEFESLGLAELDALALQDRVETKSLASTTVLPQMLDELSKGFVILEHQGRRSQLYRNVYFDTQCFDFYTAHHNQKRHRCKVRYRSYVESDVSFLEIKEKLNTGRTIKHRMRTWNLDELSADEFSLIRDNTGHEPSRMSPVVTVEYDRLTFGARSNDERVTIDLGLTFSTGSTTTRLEDLMIFEVKQDRLRHHSPAMEALNRCGLHPTSMSKYCVAVATCIDTVKVNRFKPLLRRLTELQTTPTLQLRTTS